MSATPGGAMVDAVSRVLLGKEHVVRIVVAGLLAGGHVLVEDEPGVGKTLLARAMAQAVGGSFGRVQGSPDLLPADITGVNAFNPATGAWDFHSGPIMRNVVLVDEINRATPRAQAAFFEAMAERQVTVDGQRRSLPRPFFLIATQNPREHAGVFPLPDGQIDRFAVTTSIGPPSAAVERVLVDRPVGYAAADAVAPVASLDELASAQDTIQRLHVADPVASYILALVAELRARTASAATPSPRAVQVLATVSRAWAYLGGRDHVRPDDVQVVAPAVLAHRVNHGGTEGVATVRAALDRVPAPVAP